jgi:hypothetical protein
MFPGRNSFFISGYGVFKGAHASRGGNAMCARMMCRGGAQRGVVLCHPGTGALTGKLNSTPSR